VVYLPGVQQPVAMTKIKSLATAILQVSGIILQK